MYVVRIMVSKVKIVIVMALVIVVGLYDVEFDGTLTPTKLTDEHIDKVVTVKGTVVPGTQYLSPDGSLLTFTMIDDTTSVNVTYSENQPVNLQDDMPVTVTGKYLEDHTIDSFRILSECPSKYETVNFTVPE